MTCVVLIGPMSAGKSTVGALLADRWRLPLVSLDEVRSPYYAELGYDADLDLRLREDQGLWAAYRHWKPFELHALERVLADHPHGVIDLGAGHSVYEDPAHFVRARQALASCRAVILLLPCADPEESGRLLEERFTALLRDEGTTLPPALLAEIRALNQHFLTHASNETLATLTVYTAGRTPADVCAEILRQLGSTDSRGEAKL